MKLTTQFSKYNLLNGLWSQVEVEEGRELLPLGDGISCTVCEGVAYFYGGESEDKSSCSSLLWSFDLERKTVRKICEVEDVLETTAVEGTPERRCFHSSFTWRDWVFVVFGWTHSKITSSGFIFDTTKNKLARLGVLEVGKRCRTCVVCEKGERGVVYVVGGWSGSRTLSDCFCCVMEECFPFKCVRGNWSVSTHSKFADSFRETLLFLLFAFRELKPRIPKQIVFLLFNFLSLDDYSTRDPFQWKQIADL